MDATKLHIRYLQVFAHMLTSWRWPRIYPETGQFTNFIRLLSLLIKSVWILNDRWGVMVSTQDYHHKSWRDTKITIGKFWWTHRIFFFFLNASTLPPVWQNHELLLHDWWQFMMCTCIYDSKQNFLCNKFCLIFDLYSVTTLKLPVWYVDVCLKITGELLTEQLTTGNDCKHFKMYQSSRKRCFQVWRLYDPSTDQIYIVYCGVRRTSCRWFVITTCNWVWIVR